MKITALNEAIFQLSINVENMLFEELWEIPHGASLNSYVVKGEKTAIIDGFCGWDGVPESLYDLLSQMALKPEDIDYVIINHMEPDHSGWIESFAALNDHFKVYIGAKGAEIMEAFYGQSDKLVIVSEGDTLDLGGGRVLSFHETPFVHWPDTIVTFDQLSGTLFACDLFGSFGVLKDSPFDVDQNEDDRRLYQEETVRYFSNILGSYASFVEKAIVHLDPLDIQMIAPGHGLVYKQPQTIIEMYQELASYAKGSARKEITLIWGSMYGMTEKAVLHAISHIEKRGIKLNVHRVPETSWGEILKSTWTSSAVVLAMPTYEYKMFPPMAAVLEELGSKKVTGRVAFRMGSYGWSGGAQKELDDILTRKRMKWHLIDPVEFKGNPTPATMTTISEQLNDLIDHYLNDNVTESIEEQTL